MFSVAGGIPIGMGLNADDLSQHLFATEARTRAVEKLARSSVSGSVPRRDASRRAQAAAILEARGMGMHLSIASVGTGGKDGSAVARDEQAFARLAQRFPESLRADEDDYPFRERLVKTWRARSDALADGSSPNGYSRIISDSPGRVGACVVEMRATDESLRAMLTMTYEGSAIGAIERRARQLGISASDVAFLVSAHESAHCVLGMARRAGLLDLSWIEANSKVPPSWGDADAGDDDESLALAKAEESAADILAAFWAADALGARKARQLVRLAIYARSLGARSVMHDELHNSSRALTGILELSRSARFFPVADAARVAWQTAVLDTRGDILEFATP